MSQVGTSHADGGMELDLHRCLRILRERAWLVVLAALLVAVPTVAVTNAKTPRYRASAEMLLETRRSQAIYDPSGAGAGSSLLATEVRRVQSRAISDLVAKKLGYRAEVSVSGSPLDNVITVTVVSTDPDAAALIASTFVRAYIEYRRSSDTNDILSAQTEIREKIDEKQREVAAIDDEVARAPVPQRAALAEERRAARARLVNQQDLLLGQLDRLEVNTSLDRGGVELLTPAVAPTVPFEPAVGRAAVLALVVGLMFGVGLAFAVDFFDDSIKREEDLLRATHGLPVLGTIPAAAGGKDRQAPQLLSIVEPESAVAESYRGLRTSVEFLALDVPMRILQVTSPAVSEGKTTTVANLAVALARAGHRVSAVCCDLRRPRLHEFFGLRNEVGLTSVLRGEVELAAARQPVPGVENLNVLASGPRPPNPSELLAGRHFTEVLAALLADADIVIVDSPPVLPVSDAAVLSGKVDAILLVAKAKFSRRKELRRALGMLRQVNATVAGTVLTAATGSPSYAYAYHEDKPRRREVPPQLAPNPGPDNGWSSERSSEGRGAEARTTLPASVPGAASRPEDGLL